MQYRDGDILLRSKSYEEVKEGLANGSIVLIDVRSPDIFSGEVPTPNPELPGGHIPGAHNYPLSIMQWDSPEETKRKLTSFGFDDTKELVLYCNVGYDSGVATFHLLYWVKLPTERVANFRGSVKEWHGVHKEPLITD